MMIQSSTFRKHAIVAGSFFLLAAVASITGVLFYNEILHQDNYLLNHLAHEAQVAWGAFFEILLAVSVVGTSVTLYPILKKQNESMAIGTVGFRLLEAAIILVGIICLLTVLSLKQDYAKELQADNSSWLVAGKLLVAFHNWTFLYGPNLALGPSTFMTGYLLHSSKLVPRSISLSGIIGGPLIFICAILVTFGVFPQVSVWGGLFAVPVFVYEMSLAVRLILKGFSIIPE